MQWILIIVVAIHLLAVDLAGAGPLVAIWLEWRHQQSGAKAARTLAVWSLVAAAIGTGIGLAALGIVLLRAKAQPAYVAALGRVSPDRWWFAGGEIVFYLVCITAYAFIRWPARSWARWLRSLLAIAAGTNLLYHFPALFTILAIIPTRPELAGLPVDRALYHRLLYDSETLSRVVHVCLASFAVSGVAVCWIARRLAIPAQDGLSKVGGRIAMIATLLQVPIGIWVLFALPEDQQNRLMGGDVLCTALFAGSILIALSLMHHLAILALRGDSPRNLRLASVLLGGIVLLMTAALNLSR